MQTIFKMRSDIAFEGISIEQWMDDTGFVILVEVDYFCMILKKILNMYLYKRTEGFRLKKIVRNECHESENVFWSGLNNPF